MMYERFHSGQWCYTMDSLESHRWWDGTQAQRTELARELAPILMEQARLHGAREFVVFDAKGNPVIRGKLTLRHPVQFQSERFPAMKCWN